MIAISDSNLVASSKFESEIATEKHALYYIYIPPHF